MLCTPVHRSGFLLVCLTASVVTVAINFVYFCPFIKKMVTSYLLKEKLVMIYRFGVFSPTQGEVKKE